MGYTELKFYIDGEILRCGEFKAQLKKGAYCLYDIKENCVIFLGELLCLQLSSCFSDECISYLNKNTTKVVLLVKEVGPGKLAQNLKKRKSETSVNRGVDEFALDYGDKKICGTKGCLWTLDILCEAKNSEKVSELFRAFVPGFFPKSSSPVRDALREMGFWGRLRFFFSM